MRLRKIIGRIITVFVFFWFFSWLLVIYKNLSSEPSGCKEYSETDPIKNTVLHSRVWQDLELSRENCMSYLSHQKFQSDFRALREKMEINWQDSMTHTSYWHQVYDQLAKQNESSIQFLVDSIKQIGKEQELSRIDLAELAVTFVQDIPYTLISGEDCEDYNGSCVENEAFGILSPYEFLHTLHGDCDTRSVLLYVVLRSLDFNPLIMISREYLHAMIALDIPAYGEYVEYGATRYYFWETTAKGWRPGMLPPDTNNKDYWRIALAHEL